MRMVEKCNSLTDIGVASFVKSVTTATGLDSESSLARGGAKLVRGKALMDPLGALEAVEASGGEDESIALSGGEFLEARVDVASNFDELDVRTEGKELGAAAGAGGADGSTEGQGVEGPVRLADPDVTGVGAFGDGGEGELRGQLGREIFERVDSEVDAPFFESFFDFFDEDAFAVEVGRRDEAGLLHAVAGGAYDLEFDVVAGIAERIEDVIGLPEGKLGASGANADGILRVVVLATHDFFRIRDRRSGGSLSAVNNLRYEAKEFLAFVGGEL
jgi:hypothetical protein